MSFAVGAVWRSQLGTEKYTNLAEQRQRKKKLTKSWWPCAGKDDEITKVFLDRNTRSGKSTEIKVKPKRNRKHMKLAERRTKPLPVRHMSRPILIIIVTVKL